MTTDPETEPGEPAGRDDALTAAQGAALVRLAVQTVRRRLLGAEPDVAPPPTPALAQRGASFVTLERRGRLLGCIGSLQPVRPLFLDVSRNAGRAMRDPRLPPVSADDWPELDVEVSVLTPAEPMPVAGRAELVAALRPRVDGLVLTDGVRRSTFLPAVWAKISDPAVFLDRLLVKGGWAPGGWPTGLAASRYRTVEFHDRAPRGPLGGGSAAAG
ncbi:AmmeMemoRadiSam system protein A [Actinocatenispora thailandica]|uniref:AmmeMemoRadiSam system protein A n=1 Tax=Actinocatenispora thailandica TaxID=227318 RepID=A0A7R7HY77_9ACTN|nr:AmmeMemoRadiSam system protein A [Actinocatenispora thailandica]BCJ36843.1 AmmeMemoRadiSam system protein A [Actinocatenispora thailandica]